MITDQLLCELNDKEALALLSILNCTVKDWPAITKLGGAKNILASGAVATSIVKRAIVVARATDLRAQFDRFYQTGGFLLSVIDNEACRLFNCDKAPLTFFGRFNQQILYEDVGVAIVGARKASPEGLRITQKWAAHLAERDISVISGGAVGIDQAAHRAALAASGKTVVISGVACDFNNSHVPALSFPHDPDRTVVIYPFGPFMPQGKYMFVERNRFVVAHAHALLVVEGQMGSGTLHTARFGHELSCPIFAVPRTGNVHGYVPNYLLRTGKARDVANFEQFVEALVTKTQKPPKRRDNVVKEHMGKTKKSLELPYLLQVISDHENSLGFDDLLVVTGLSFGELQKELLGYELEGRIFKQGAQFVLTGD